MSLRGRAILRGKKLDSDCKKATISTNESGPDDKRMFCLGLVREIDHEHLDKCKMCGAFAFNAQPLNANSR